MQAKHFPTKQMVSQGLMDYRLRIVDVSMLTVTQLIQHYQDARAPQPSEKLSPRNDTTVENHTDAALCSPEGTTQATVIFL